MSPDGPSIQFEVKVAGDSVLLYRHDYFLRKHEFVALTPEEAWDLGDDLFIAASRVKATRMITGLVDADVAQDAEGEDGDAHADPTVPEAELKAQAVGDAHGGGDYVEKDGHGT